MSYGFDFAPLGFATAADGTGPSPLCPPGGPTEGCRVVDIPIDEGNWSLVALPDSAIVDPTVVIGRDSVIEQDVIINAGAFIGNDTVIHEGAHICSDATIGSFVSIGKNRLVDTGVNVPDGIVWADSVTPPGACTP